MPSSPFHTLRRFAKRAPAPVESEYCDFCSVLLYPAHRHLVELDKRRILCVCDACALRFQDVVQGRFKLVPRDARALPGFVLSDAQWESFAIPIGLAFFFFSTPTGKITALYPGPGGATESLLPLTAWNSLVSSNPALAEMQSDVEALLVNRVGTARQHYIAPMDRCYELVGLLRIHWRGLSGGDAVWQEIGGFFSRLEQQAGP